MCTLVLSPPSEVLPGASASSSPRKHERGVQTRTLTPTAICTCCLMRFHDDQTHHRLSAVGVLVLHKRFKGCGFKSQREIFLLLRLRAVINLRHESGLKHYLSKTCRGHLKHRWCSTRKDVGPSLIYFFSDRVYKSEFMVILTLIVF